MGFFALSGAGKDGAFASYRAWQDGMKDRGRDYKSAGTFNIYARGDSAEIMLFDEIGFWGVTAKQFNKELSAITAKNITVRINSPGGDVFDGSAIYTALVQHPAQITTHVDGIAASAASYIAMAGNRVVMAENAMMMVHRAWGFTMGNCMVHLDQAETLEKIDGMIASIYAKKSGMSDQDALSMMTGKIDGTWFTAQEALDAKLIDEISGTDSGSKNIADRILGMRRRLALAERECA